MSEEEAATVVDNLQSDPVVIDLLLAECEDGTSARGFGALATAGVDFRPGRREVATAASEIMYKYYFPQAVSS